MSGKVSFSGQMQLIPIAIILAIVPTAILAQAAMNSSQLSENNISLSETATPVVSPESPQQILEAITPEDLYPASTNESAEETHPENTTFDITNQSIPAANETWTNGTLNETLNGTIPAPEEDPQSDKPDNETTEENQTSTDVPPQQKKVSVSLRLPQRTNRLETFTAYAGIANTGNADIKQFSVEWILPYGFVLQAQSTDCAELLPGESCTASAVIAASADSTLGPNSIKARVSYG